MRALRGRLQNRWPASPTEPERQSPELAHWWPCDVESQRPQHALAMRHLAQRSLSCGLWGGTLSGQGGKGARQGVPLPERPGSLGPPKGTVSGSSTWPPAVGFLGPTRGTSRSEWPLTRATCPPQRRSPERRGSRCWRTERVLEGHGAEGGWGPPPGLTPSQVPLHHSPPHPRVHQRLRSERQEALHGGRGAGTHALTPTGAWRVCV